MLPRRVLLVGPAMQALKEALLHWVAAEGGHVHPALDIMAHVGNGERGVVAVSQVQEGEQLAILPLCLCLHTPTAAASTPQVKHAWSVCCAPQTSILFFPVLAQQCCTHKYCPSALRRIAASVRSFSPAGSRLCDRLSPRSSCCCTSCPRYFPAHQCSCAPQTVQRLAAPGCRSQGAASFYAPYLATLPAGHNCVLGWREDEKAELKGKWLAAADMCCDHKVWF